MRQEFGWGSLWIQLQRGFHPETQGPGQTLFLIALKGFHQNR